MNGLRLVKLDATHVRLTGIDWVTASCLLEVPAILPLAQSGPAQERLYQGVSATDPHLNEDWKTLVTPEIQALFADAGKILATDIVTLVANKKTSKQQSLTFPIAHLNAWMSALNQARLILGAQHAVTEKEMDEREFTTPDNPIQQAVLRIHVLGYLLQVLVEFVSEES